MCYSSNVDKTLISLSKTSSIHKYLSQEMFTEKKEKTLRSRQQQGRFPNTLFHCPKKGSVNFSVSVSVLCVHETQN